MRDFRNGVAPPEILRPRVLELAQQLEDLPDHVPTGAEPQIRRVPVAQPLHSPLAIGTRKPMERGTARAWWTQ